MLFDTSIMFFIESRHAQIRVYQYIELRVTGYCFHSDQQERNQLDQFRLVIVPEKMDNGVLLASTCFSHSSGRGYRLYILTNEKTLNIIL